MSLKELVVLKDGNEQTWVLEKERLVIGRDAKCDVVLDHSGVSRRHAVIIAKFDAVYIENISSTGRILQHNDPVEYVQLQANDEVQIEGYTLFWRELSSKKAAAPAELGTPSSPEILSASASVLDSPQPDGASSDFGQSSAIDASANMAAIDDPPSDGSAASLSSDMHEEGSPNTADFAAIPPAMGDESSDKTQIVLSRNDLSGLLKGNKGEIAGQEYRLEHGSTWTVGRSEKCQVFIDNAKLSRQHFQIVRIGNAFRVQDLNSAHGTRLNGVAITDAPLQAFDTLQAGSLEWQFLIVDPQKVVDNPSAPAPALMAASLGEGGAPLSLENGPELAISPGENFSAQEKTQFAAPALYKSEDFAQSAVPPQNPYSSFANSTPLGQGRPTMTEAPRGGILVWIQAQPTGRKALYGALLVLGLAAAALTNVPTAPAPNVSPDAAVAKNEPVTERKPAAQLPAPLPKMSEPNAADPREVSSEFSLLSKEKQEQVRDHYARAERARAARDWTGAFENSKAIFDLGVKRYKNAAEIMDEAQTYLNEGSLGNISKSLSTLQDAQEDVKERVNLLVDNGEQALKEQRWNDASESFLKAVNLDPQNEAAARGYTAAQAKNAGLQVADLPKDIPVNDPEFQEAEREKEVIAGNRRIYQDVKSKMQNGNFREALPHLKNLDKTLTERLDEYDTASRAPASFRDGFKQETKSLQSQVREAIETSQAQLRTEYAAQLADADQLINNKQYAEARETYDRIIRSNPYFDEAVDARDKLYAKLLTEAKTLYHEALIYESVSDINNAVEGYKKSRELLTNVNNGSAIEYYKKSVAKLKRLEP